MSRSVQIKAALVTALVAAATLGRTLDGPVIERGGAEFFMAGLWLFGLANVVFAPRGTEWVRGFAIGGVLFGLLTPGPASVIVAVLAWLAWPPAFLVAWATSDPSSGSIIGTGDEEGRKPRMVLAAIIGSVALAATAYRVVFGHGLQQTAALFVGVPALLAIAVVFGVSPRSATGVAVKAVTVGLLVSLLFLGEGMLCVAMSAPLFYFVAIAIGKVADRRREEAGMAGSRLYSGLFLLALVPMSLEGVTHSTSFNRDEVVSRTAVVQASTEEVERALLATPRFDRALPLYLRAGFPRPTAVRVGDTAGAGRWIITFRGGEMRLDGMEPRAGDLVLDLQEARPGFLRWRALADSSHMTHFLDWQESSVAWEAVDQQSTRVTWTLRYRRGLDPAWYFGPWERYAVQLAADYLIAAVATP
jgi:hypothetical protein